MNSKIRKKTLAIYISAFNVGGAEISTLLLINELINNYNILLITGLDYSDLLIKKLNKKVIHKVLPKKKSINQLIYLYIYLLFKKDIDTMISICSHTNIIATLTNLLLIKKYKLILSERAILKDNLKLTNLSSKLTNILIPFLYNHSDYIHCISKSVSLSLPKKIDNKKVKIIPNIINKRNVNNQSKFSNNIIRFYTISRLSSDKNIKDQIYLIYFLLKNKLLDKKLISLTIYGEGDQLSNLKKLTKDLKVQNYVFFKGLIDPFSKIPYQENDILISTSLHEGFGRSIADALVNNIPVLSYKFSASNIFGNSNILFLAERNNISSLAFKIKDILKLLNSKEIYMNEGNIYNQFEPKKIKNQFKSIIN